MDNIKHGNNARENKYHFIVYCLISNLYDSININGDIFCFPFEKGNKIKINIYKIIIIIKTIYNYK